MTRNPEILTPEAPTPVNYAKRIYTFMVVGAIVGLLILALALAGAGSASNAHETGCMNARIRHDAGLATSSQVALACR